eukprot:1263931-Pyramimonas_sp.AAC.1
MKCNLTRARQFPRRFSGRYAMLLYGNRRHEGVGRGRIAERITGITRGYMLSTLTRLAPAP